MATCSTGTMFALTLDGRPLGGPREMPFYISLALALGVTVVAMLFALWKTGRAWQDQAAKPTAATAVGNSGSILRHRARVLDSNPLEWLASDGDSAPDWYGSRYYWCSPS